MGFTIEISPKFRRIVAIKSEKEKNRQRKSITEKIYNDFIIHEKLYSVCLTHLLGIGIGIEKKSLKAEDST